MTTKQLLSAAALAGLLVAPAAAQTNVIPTPQTSTASVEHAIVTYFATDSVADVQLGELGEQKAHNASLKQLAREMVTDHTKTAGQAMRLAKQLGANGAELKPSEDGQIEYAHLAAESGSTFDKDYAQTLVDAHKTDIGVAKNALTVTSDSALKQYLNEAIAVDQKHLALAQKAAQELKTPSTSRQ